MLNSRKIKSASIWSFFETIMATGLGIFSIIFLAKLLTPQDYGMIATAQFISGFIQIILSLGLNDVILQKKELEDKEIQTFWVATLGISLIAFLITIIISFIFYKNNQLIISKILVFEGINTSLIILAIVPTALLMRNLEMKSFFFRNVFSRIIFFIIAIPLAFNNFGLWSIVYSNLAQALTSFILLYMVTRKKIPKKIHFDRKIFIDSMNFGFFVMLESLLWSFLSRVLGLLIAVFHGTSALGLYNMASKLTDTILNILNSSITRITLPIFSSVQDNKNKLLFAFQSSTYYFNMLSMPTFFGMALTSSYWVPLILGEKWHEIIPLIQVISIMYGVMYSRMFVGIAIKALGRSKEFLYLSFTAAGITLISLFFTRNMSLIIAVIALAVPRIIITIPLGVFLMKKICKFSILEQLVPLKIPILLSILVVLNLVLIQFFYKANLFISLAFQIGFSLVIFLIFNFILFKLNRLKW